MRRLTLPLLLSGLLAASVSTLATAAPPAPTSPPASVEPAVASPALPDAAEPVFVVTGGGWGHGVGLSQWGAYGQASAGRTYDQILSTYFRGTQLGRTGKVSVRVLMADGVDQAAFEGTGAVVVTDATGRKLRIRDGNVVIPTTFELDRGANKPLVSLVPPVTVTPTLDVHVAYGGVVRRGSYVVSVSGDKLLVVNQLPLESYLRGVVPGEVPVEWPAEALEAQAVAARTYAITSLVPDRPFDLYADVRSQVYAGLPAESPSTDAAVLATSGRIVTFDGSPARTFYFSSSGGRTASALDVFGTDVPYLQSVPDPWDVTSPHHLWPAKTFTAVELGRALGASGPVGDVRPAASDDGSPKLAAIGPATPALLHVVSADGSSIDLSLRDVRARLGLASTNFRLGELAVAPPLESPRPGSVVTVSGTARAVDSPMLEKQRPDGSWQVVRKLKPLPDGTWSVTVKPLQTTVFRVSGSGVSGPSASVVVPAA